MRVLRRRTPAPPRHRSCTALPSFDSVVGMRDHALALLQSVHDLSGETGLAADFHGAPVSQTVLHHEHRPAFALTEQRARREPATPSRSPIIRSSPPRGSRRPVGARLVLGGGRSEGQYHLYALLLHAERRALVNPVGSTTRTRASRGRSPPHRVSVTRVPGPIRTASAEAAPGLRLRWRARLAHLDQRGPPLRNGTLAFPHHVQHASRHRRAHRDQSWTSDPHQPHISFSISVARAACTSARAVSTSTRAAAAACSAVRSAASARLLLRTPSCRSRSTGFACFAQMERSARSISFFQYATSTCAERTCSAAVRDALFGGARGGLIHPARAPRT